jgi:hypothetical protein
MRWTCCCTRSGQADYSVYGWSARRPNPRVGGPEEDLNGGTDGGCKVGDPGIVPDENPRAAQPAGQLVEIVDSDCAIKFFFRSAEPVDGHRFGKCPRCRLENVHRRPFAEVAGERVDDREGPLSRRAIDFRKSRCGARSELIGLFVIEVNGMSAAGRQRLQELKRQAKRTGELAEIRPIGPIPGNDGIEAPQTADHIVGWQQSEPVKSRCNNGLRRVSEAGNGNVLAGTPDFGVVRTQRFERRQADYKIADRTRSNQKACQMNHQL